MIILLFLTIFSMVLVVWAIEVIGKWKIFGKANQPQWAAFIPIYNTYILCKAVGVNPWWLLVVFCGGMISSIPYVGSILFSAISIYFGVLIAVSTAKSFGKSDGFAVGLFFLQPIFHLILGFGNSEYQGPKPMEDVVMNKAKDIINNNTNNNQNPTNSETKESKYCQYCGTKIPTDSKVCPNCGKNI